KLEKVHERHLRPAATGKRKSFVVVRRVQSHGDSRLPQVRQTTRGVCLHFRAAERRQKQAGKDRNDCNHDQQLDESESVSCRVAESAVTLGGLNVHALGFSASLRGNPRVGNFRQSDWCSNVAVENQVHSSKGARRLRQKITSTTL